MRSLLLFFLLALCATAYSQAKPVEIFSEKTAGGATIYARNTEASPYSLSLELDLTNMQFSEGDTRLFVIPANEEKMKVGVLTAEPGKRFKWSYQFKTTLGDVTKKHDADYVYDLPFAKGSRFKLFQGYNGSFTHRNEKALDFTMPEGTPVLGAREGKVVRVVQHHNQHCTTEDCTQYNNVVTILHSDGSFATYAHLQYNGSLVKVGDEVKKGDKIALSGNTGYSSGPHLHFVCFQPEFGKYSTVETKFRMANNTVGNLSEGTVYQRDY
jgi:murein DD-endopeptidase MepM/ murein hydrolase activator NlpD